MVVSKQPDARHNKSRWISSTRNVLFEAQGVTDSGAPLHFHLGAGVVGMFMKDTEHRIESRIQKDKSTLTLQFSLKRNGSHQFSFPPYISNQFHKILAALSPNGETEAPRAEAC